MDSAQPGPKPRAKRRRLRGLLVALGVLAALDQGLHRIAFRDGFFRQVRVAPFDPPLFSEVQFQAIEGLRAEARGRVDDERVTSFDPDLGWNLIPAAGTKENEVDAEGARRDEHAAANARILAYGCSYTYGSEVQPKETWPNQLSGLLEDTRVVNLGVPGYGVDQALLRFYRQQLKASEVWLCYLPFASTRAVVQYRPVLRHYSSTVAFKPRFTLDAAGGLELQAQPARTPTERLELVLDSRRFVDAVGSTDAYVRDLPAAFGPMGSHWSHHSGLGRAALTLLDRRRPDPLRRLARTDDEARLVVTAIGQRMAAEAAKRGMRFRILVLPSQAGLAECATAGTAPWQSIVDEWRAAGLEVFDMAEAVESVDTMLEEKHWMPGGHYSPLGNSLVAAAIAEELRE